MSANQISGEFSEGKETREPISNESTENFYIDKKGLI